MFMYPVEISNYLENVPPARNYSLQITESRALRVRYGQQVFTSTEPVADTPGLRVKATMNAVTIDGQPMHAVWFETSTDGETWDPLGATIHAPVSDR